MIMGVDKKMFLNGKTMDSRFVIASSSGNRFLILSFQFFR